MTAASIPAPDSIGSTAAPDSEGEARGRGRLLLATDDREVVAEEGQTIRSWLRVVAGCIDADERTLMLAAQRLVHLPTVRRWLAGGTLVAVRSIGFTTRRLVVIDPRRCSEPRRAHDDVATPKVHGWRSSPRAASPRCSPNVD